MFNAQRLLGQVMQEALGGGLGRQGKRRKGSFTGLPRGMEAKVGIGLLGVALAAFEHFRSTGNPASPPPSPLAAGGVGANTGAMPPPPPPPGRPMPAMPPADPRDQANSLLLLRIMIAAAHADGVVDATERGRLLDRARAAGLGAEELMALGAELAQPRPLSELAANVPTELREQAYAAALVATDIDHPEEHRFLADLASALALDSARQAAIRGQFDA